MVNSDADKMMFLMFRKAPFDNERENLAPQAIHGASPGAVDDLDPAGGAGGPA
jgi:hypothetical protein